jgi:hypothetical protein
MADDHDRLVDVFGDELAEVLDPTVHRVERRPGGAPASTREIDRDDAAVRLQALRESAEEVGASGKPMHCQDRWALAGVFDVDPAAARR